MWFPSPDSLHLQLKSATQTLHEALHKQPLLHRLMEPGCTLSDYRTILNIFHRFYLQAEVSFRPMLAEKFDEEAPVLSWLTQDLCAVGGVDLASSGRISSVNILSSQSDATEKKADFPRYLGYLYVKQGSTLGGQVLSRTLSRNLGLAPERGLRFFSGYGEQTRQNWLYFLRYLDSHQASTDIPKTVTSACEYFQTLEIMFDQAAEQMVC